MKIPKLIYLVLASAFAIASVGSVEVMAAKKKTKSKTKTSKTYKKRTTTSRKKTTRRKTTTVNRKQYVAPVEKILTDSLTLSINDSVLKWIPESLNPGGLRINSVITESKTSTVKVGLNENFTYVPLTTEWIGALRRRVVEVLPDSLNGMSVSLNVGDKKIEYFINTIDKLPEPQRKGTQFVVPSAPYVNSRKGMQGDIVALWHSHGRYFKPGSGSWLWQRPLLFQTAEDTHTMSYILPYAVPMLENAGAYVLLPRERCVNSNEVIVDNDTNETGQIFSQPYYKETTGSKPWVTGEYEGFIYDLPDFRDTENPFENGTYRQTETVTSGKKSIAAWYADIPEDGEYAVYVSYKTLPESTTDALYTVNYSGGSREFKVNQKMGGGTWVYLGTFPLEAGYSDTEPIVTLTNMSSKEGMTITADAVKIGGGMGNIARSDRRSDIYYDPSTPEDLIQVVSDNVFDADDLEYVNEEIDETEEIDENENDSIETLKDKTADPQKSKGPAPVFKTSGMPRFLEGARYWLHWAGAPEEVYSPYHGTDDYKDDYTSRGNWVNWLAGGSRILPDQDGLNIPVDVAVALHSDAGKRDDDSFVGTLGIYYTNGGDRYADGTPRTNSRALTDLLMRQITGDIRQTWEPNWTRRSMWDKSYVEARVPEVPTSLIEFMSHQNFADMKYALDPEFRFTVGRSIYKAIGRFMAERKDRKFIVQPLPVKDFAISRVRQSIFRLSWQPTQDRLEPTASPTKYLVFERTADELGFHLLGETTSTHFNIKVDDHDIHSFKIVAANDGGLSFPSEILALREGINDSNPVLIVNGFTRTSGPAWYSASGNAGFDALTDFGVPDKQDISFMGYQTEFRRNAGESFGKSNGNYATEVIAGNTFDYPYIHGMAISESGFGFVSASVGALVNEDYNLKDFSIIDLILGKQKATVTGNGNTGFRHLAFPLRLQQKLRVFCEEGGDLFVSGQYVASDPNDYRSAEGSADFASNILGIKLSAGQKPSGGRLESSGNAIPLIPSVLPYSSTLNSKQYIVENPDIIEPSGLGNQDVFLCFSDTGSAAGIATVIGNSRVAVMSVPFETIESAQSRSSLMKGILHYLTK